MNLEEDVSLNISKHERERILQNLRQLRHEVRNSLRNVSLGKDKLTAYANASTRLNVLIDFFSGKNVIQAGYQPIKKQDVEED
jgi:hypothetical protein